MKPDTRTVNELFERDVRYVVPLFQRPYVWDETDQWEPLWEDMLVLLRHQAIEAGVQSHFLGAIVLDYEAQIPGRIPQYVVIDGQQRLTTLQLLISAAQQVMEELGHTDPAGILADLTRNDPRKATGDELLKVWPTNVNRAAFKSVLLPGTVGGTDDPNNLIQEAHAYFRARVSEWITDDVESGSPADRAERLRVVVSDLLKAVTITLEAGDNAQVIFETLNARGTPLLALDLVKNAVFQEATRQGELVDQLYEEVWKPQLDAEYWREERRQGRLYRARAELFLTHWLGMKLEKLIPSTELFAIFRKQVLIHEPRPKAAAVIREMVHDARVMRSFDAQAHGTTEALFFERLEALDVTTVMPLVLMLFTKSDIEVDTRRRSLRMLESWLVRRSLLRLTTKSYTREIGQLLHKVGGDPPNADRTIYSHITGATGEASRWPRDEDVMTYLSTRDAYGNVAGGRLVMVLRAIEQSMYKSNIDLPDVPDGLTLEHVMPQEWRGNWPLGEGVDGGDATERATARDMILHRLGNLTLVTGAMNSTMSNSAWDTKKQHLNEGTKLLLNVELLGAYGDRFDDGSIERRTVALAARACTIWPGPEAEWL